MRSFAFAAVASVSVLSLSCSSDPAPSSAGATLADKYQKLGERLGKTLALVKSSATTAVTVAPSDLAGVARLPKDATGDVDVSVEYAGKSGDKPADVDGVEGDEQLTVFVPDPATSGTATSASTPSFVAWRGSAASKDEGLCYLAWTKAASWFVASRCGDASGAWVCKVTSDGSACSACGSAGECAPCDTSLPSFDCRW